MTQVIQLQFDFTPHPAPQQEDGEQKTDVPKGRKVIWEDDTFRLRMLEPTKRAGKNPCDKCYLREVCDNDSCGHKRIVVTKTILKYVRIVFIGNHRDSYQQSIDAN